jgi:DNA-binding NarL/FixJ family response regulator
MSMQLLIAAPDTESIELYDRLLDRALRLLPLDIAVSHVTTRADLTARAVAQAGDVLILDWLLAGAETPDYLRQLLAFHPRLRTLVVMPLDLRQYRACLWQAGACVGLPKEHLDHEWLLSMLCLMNRAMAREERVREELLSDAVATIEPGARPRSSPAR